MPARRLALVAAGLVLLAVAYTAAWFHAAGSAETLLAVWTDKGRAAGFEASYGSVATAGFPFAFHLTIEEPRIVSLPPHPPWSWRTDTIVLETRPWALHRPSLALPGEQILLVGKTNDQASYTATGERVRIAFRLSATLEAVRLDLRAVQIEHARWPQALRIAHAEIDWREETSGMALDVDVAGLALPEMPAGPLGSVIDALAGRLRTGGPSPAGVRPGALAAWRDDGGTLEVEAVRLRWGPLAATAEGTVTLDSENRPMGALNARIVGVGEVVESFVAAGQLSGLEALAIKIGLDALIGPEDRAIRLPATMQDGRLYLGGFAVASLAPLF